MTATMTTAAQPATRRAGVGAIVALGGRIERALRRRAGRLLMAALVFVLLLPLLLTSLLGGR
jgi:hypothetical protein